MLGQLKLLLWKNYILQVGLGGGDGGWWGSLGAHSPAVSVSLETEGPGDSLGALAALAVLWDPDLASLEDPVGKRAQRHHLPWPVHPGAAALLQLPPSGRHLGARLHPVPQ